MLSAMVQLLFCGRKSPGNKWESTHFHFFYIFILLGYWCHAVGWSIKQLRLSVASLPASWFLWSRFWLSVVPLVWFQHCFLWSGHWLYVDLFVGCCRKRWRSWSQHWRSCTSICVRIRRSLVRAVRSGWIRKTVSPKQQTSVDGRRRWGGGGRITGG